MIEHSKILQKIEPIIRDQWHALFPGRQVAKKFIFRQERGFRKTLVFIYDYPAKTMLAVAHVVEDPKVETRLRNHYTILKTIHRSDDTAITKTVPAPVHFSVEKRYLLLIQTAVTGTVLNRKARTFLFFSRSSFEKYMHLTVDWLIKLHSVFRSDQQKIEETKLAKIGNDLPWLREKYSAVKDYSLPLVLEHIDFAPRNLLFNNSSLSVIDWEYSTLQGLPLWDLVHCLIIAFRTVYSFSGTFSPFSFLKHLRSHHVKKLLFSDTYYSGVIKELIRKYCQKMKITPEVGDLLLFTKIVDFITVNNLTLDITEDVPANYLV